MGLKKKHISPESQIHMNPTGHGTCGPTGLTHFTGEAAHRVDRATYLTTGSRCTWLPGKSAGGLFGGC